MSSAYVYTRLLVTHVLVTEVVTVLNAVDVACKINLCNYFFSAMSCFRGDFNFCPECGNILPVPGRGNTITCPRCSFEIAVRGERHVTKCNLWQGF